MSAPVDLGERWQRHGAWLVVALGALARLPALIAGVEHYGDAPVRIEAAERWIAAPHLWRGFAEAFQYGPLHLTLLGFAARLAGRYAGPKLLSFACGLACLWLVHRVAKRAAGDFAALAAGVGLAFSPLHIQASTTGASEAVFLALLLGAVDALLSGRTLLAAALLGVSSLVRYDGLLYVGLFGLVLAWQRRPRAAAGLFALAMALPALWLLRCWQIDGDPLAAIRHINADHRMLAENMVRWFGRLGYRLYSIPYWPVAVIGIGTPVLGAFAVAGSARTLASVRPSRAPSAAQILAVLAWAPPAYFTFRAAVLVDFRPMARFAMVAAALSLPLAGAPLRALFEWLGAAGRRALLAFIALSFIAWPAALVALSYGRDGSSAEWARPLSPITTMPPGVKQAADWVRANAGPRDVVLLDSTWHYLDIVLAFDAGLPEAQYVRKHWPDFEEKLRRSPPTMAVLLDGGSLFTVPGASGAKVGADSFTFRELKFCAARHFSFASVYRRCAQ